MQAFTLVLIFGVWVFFLFLVVRNDSRLENERESVRKYRERSIEQGVKLGLVALEIDLIRQSMAKTSASDKYIDAKTYIERLKALTLGLDLGKERQFCIELEKLRREQQEEREIWESIKKTTTAMKENPDENAVEDFRPDFVVIDDPQEEIAVVSLDESDEATPS